MSGLLVENSCVRPWVDKFRSSFLCKISAEQSKVRRQTGSCMESTVRESWLVRETDSSSVSSDKRARALPCQPPKFVMSQQTVVRVALIFAKLSENYRIFRLFLEIRQFRCIVQHWLWSLSLRFEARACLWLPQCFEEIFGTITFVRVTSPA